MDSHQLNQSFAVVRVTQAAFVWRLVALLLVALFSVAQQPTARLYIAIALVALPTAPGLFSARYRRVMSAHPSLLLGDLLLLSAGIALVGVDTPLLLALLTSGLLVGLWVRQPGAPLIMISLMGLYLLLLTQRPLTASDISIRLFVIPAVLLLLWMLGSGIRRAAVAEADSQATLVATMAAAAASEERLRVAQDLHDTFAKTLQGIRFSVAAIPATRDDPLRAEAIIEDLDEMCRVGVTELRGLMTGLRRTAANAPLPALVHQIVTEWQQRSGIQVELAVDAHAGVASDASVFAMVMGLQEALENISRHAPQASVSVSLARVADDVRLSVLDDGPGCDQIQAHLATQRGHFGVQGMRERLAAVGGHCLWTSSIGVGTSVELTVRQRDLRQMPTVPMMEVG